MRKSTADVTLFKKSAADDSTLKWYVIADSAQSTSLPQVLSSPSRKLRCLFGVSRDNPLAIHAPHLVELASPAYGDSAWIWIGRNGPSTPCLSVIATTKPFDTLFHQLSSFLEVVLPNAEMMWLAYWDGAILGSLFGQRDDSTLHIPGPVLNKTQRSQMTAGLGNWWYWDRVGKMHALSVCASGNEFLLGPLELDQQQVDDLVEASVPDHVLYYLTLNQASLLNDVPPPKQYEVVRGALIRARGIGLTSMRDLVDFVCIELHYKERMADDAIIVELLSKVRSGELNFIDAANEFP